MFGGLLYLLPYFPNLEWLERGQSKKVKECNFRFHVLRSRLLYHGSFLACFNDKGEGRDKTYLFMKQEILL
jgi:hypothetical protein